LPAEIHTKQIKELLKSVGPPVYWTRVKIVEPGVFPLKEVDRLAVGEIVTKGPHVMKGYWNNPQLTKETIVDGWLRTGDAGYMNKDGYVFIVDRIKDMIITGGENVYSAEVENCIMQFEIDGEKVVQMCAVVGVPDAKLVEKVAAYVVLKDIKQ